MNNLDIVDRIEPGKIPWDEIIDMFPILAKLEAVDQSPIHHQEGNVLTHTKMVVEQMVGFRGIWENFPEHRTTMFLAALFHDIGKLETTEEEEGGKITSVGHSAKGARLIRELLWDFRDDGFPVSWQIRETVANMALLHMLPVYFLQKEDPLYSVAASSYTVSNWLLELLASADTRGRVCENNKETEDMIELFGDFCAEQGCQSSPIHFESDHSRFLYFFEHAGHPKLPRYHDCKGTVHMMSGLPGSGKDYWIRKNLPGLPTVGLDDLRQEMGVEPLDNQGKVSQLAKERCREQMRVGQDFIFNATNFLKQTRARWIRLFNQYNYKVHIHYIEPGFQVLQKQNMGREKKVPAGIVREMFTKLEPPTLLECHELSVEA